MGSTNFDPRSLAEDEANVNYSTAIVKRVRSGFQATWRVSRRVQVRSEDGGSEKLWDMLHLFQLAVMTTKR